MDIMRSSMLNGILTENNRGNSRERKTREDKKRVVTNG